MRELGYYAELTSYSKDGGIDVFLQDKSSRLIGVQVKRYKDTILVEEIQKLLGAMILNDVTAGMFVTTSVFSKGSKEAVEEAGKRGLEIELVDGQRLFEFLGLARMKRNSSWSAEDFGIDASKLALTKIWYEQFKG